jgi:uncharacterized protein
MRTVARLSVTPVKSLGLNHPSSVELKRYGVPGNRLFFVADPDGTLVSGSRVGTLVAIHAEYGQRGEEWLALRFPDESVVEGDAAAGASVVRSNFYGRPVTGLVVAGPWSDALSSYAGRPLVLVRAVGEGAGNDDSSASIFSTASAEELARRSGSDRPLDSRRFRMLIEVAGCEPHEEDRWVGRKVGVGEAVVEVIRPVRRCVVTTQDPSTGVKDFDTLSAIRAYRGVRDGNGIDFGVYAGVLAPGTVRVGDPVQPLP